VSSMPALSKWKSDFRFHQDTDPNLFELRRLFDDQREQLQHARRELQEYRPLAMIGRMAQFISHDLRHHLSAIYAGAEFMSLENTLPADREALLKEVSDAIGTMTGLLDSLLMFAQTGRALHLHPGSLNLLIEGAVTMVRSHPDADGVQIVIEDLPRIESWMDCKLGSALYNLLLNACQAAKRGMPPGIVRVALSQDQATIHLRVTDSGPGIPASIRDTLFQPFVTDSRKNGIGLGLTIAQCVAREHGGFVSIEESSPRRTVFVLHLPKRALAALTPECSAKAVSQQS
jgi:signal transduction histidine kinase